MNKIIFSVSVGGGECFRHCVESQKRYSKRIGSEYLVIDSWRNWNEDLKTDCEKRHAVELLKNFDKVLYLDADVFIKDDAKDIFDFYRDDNNLIMYNEVLFNGVQMDDHIKGLIKKNNLETWGVTGGHYDWLNAGVILCTKGMGHEAAFHYDPKEFFKFDDLPMIYDMPFMNYMIFKNKISVTNLDERFNTMVFFHDNGGFLHFANVLDRDKRILEYV